MEFARRGPATATAAGDASDGRRVPDRPPHGESLLVIRDALQGQLQKDRLRQGIIEAELAKIDRAMALGAGSSSGISTSDSKPVSYSLTEGLVSHGGISDAVHDPKKKDASLVELKSGKPNDKTGQESNETIQPMSHSLAVELMEIEIPIKQTKAPNRWSCTVCQVGATSELNLQQHYAGQKHRSIVASLQSRNNGGRQQAMIQAILQKESKSVAVDYVHLPPIPVRGTLNSSDSNIASLEMTRHMMSLYFCKVCNVRCSNEFMFADHRRGKKHRAKMWKHKRMTYCQVCNLQCNSEQMLADHFAGQKHQKNARLMGLI